ncbi:MAG: hypothetical protein ACFHHU_00470 [Porticoccaceae bacterium]
MPNSFMTDEELVVAVNQLAWRYLSHLGRNYSGTAPLHTLVDQDPRVRSAFDMAAEAFSTCRGSDIESALAEAGDDVANIDYSSLCPIGQVAIGASSLSLELRCANVGAVRNNVEDLHSRLVKGNITIADACSTLSAIRNLLNGCTDQS